MKNTTKGFLAGAAGLGLILGGSTFALWTDSADMRNEAIQSGNLQVKVSKADWRDMSDDRTDAGHKIKDLRAFRIIPGDTIQAKFPVKVALQGDNMVAQLNLIEGGKRGGWDYTAQDLEAQTADTEDLATEDLNRDRGGGDLARGLNITYQVFGSDGKPVATGGKDGVQIHLASRDNSNPGGITQMDRRGEAEFNVVVTVEFDKNTSKRDLTESQARLAGADIELKQVREGVDGYKSGGRK